MPLINAIMTVGGQNFHWQMQDLREDNESKVVLALHVQSLVEFVKVWRYGMVDWIAPPEDLASPWMFDLDRARERVTTQHSSGFPEWARGKAAAPPVDGRCFEITERHILSGPST